MTELRHLRYFHAVAEELHFGRAASRLGVSQPPLSRQIKELEEEVGVELFRRCGRHVELTAAGQVFFTSTRSLLEDLARSIQRARALAAGQEGTLAIGFSEIAASSGLLRHTLSRFRKLNPSIDVTLEEMTSTEQAIALREGRVAVTLGYRFPPLTDDAIAHQELLNDPLVLAVPTDDVLASHPNEIDAKELSKRTLLFMRRVTAPELHNQVLVSLRSWGIVPRQIREERRLRSVFALIGCGAGFGLTPISTTLTSVPGVSFYPLPEDSPLRLSTHVFYLAGSQNGLVKRFADATLESAVELRTLSREIARARGAPTIANANRLGDA